MTDFIIQTIFLGFSLYTLLKILFINLVRNENVIFNKSVDDSGVFVVRYMGIVFMVLFILTFLTSINNTSDKDYFSNINRMFGPYWFAFWIYPFAYSFLTQLLWIKTIKDSPTIRFFIAFVILIAVSIEKVIIILTSFHRDHLPSGWTYSTNGLISSFIIKWVVGFAVFLGIILATNEIRKRIKTMYNSTLPKAGRT